MNFGSYSLVKPVAREQEDLNITRKVSGVGRWGETYRMTKTVRVTLTLKTKMQKDVENK